MRGKFWKIAAAAPETARRLADELKISTLMAQLLLNRGLVEPTQAVDFLTPNLSQLHDPFLFQDMEPAVFRIMQAVKRNESVLIHGDYDVDGITATALLIKILARYLPGRLLYYIPKRLEEGYGVHRASLEKAVARGVSLIITVDCGISAVTEGEYLREKGVDLIITDHHEPPRVLPQAYAILNPKLEGSAYPFTQLAGVGVAFKLLQGISREIPAISEELSKNLDLVAFGTVADIVPLLEENRILVKFGLEQFNNTANIGLQALIQVAGLKNREITTGQISYVLAPRINAAGRMGSSGIGVKLLTSNELQPALEYARELEKENQNRQETEDIVFQDAKARIDSQPELASEHALVLAGAGWHLGVIGIVASKLVELYHKPVILIGTDGPEGRGSGRSIPGFNLFTAIENCGQYLLKFGGHEFAAGLSIESEMIPLFKKAFQELARRRLAPEDLQPVLKVEGLIDLSRATLDLARELTRLAPCGPANPTPVLGCEALNLLNFKSVGENGKHLKVKVTDETVIREGIGFNLGFACEELAGAKEIDLAFSLEENIWNGASNVQLNLKDIRTTGEMVKRVNG